jgi:hypothetical protein
MTGIMMSTRRRIAVSSIVPSLVSATYADETFDPLDAECRLTFVNDGSLVVHRSLGGNDVQVGQWLSAIDATQAALYEIECVITAGAAFNAAGTNASGAGVWRDGAVGANYGNIRTSNGSKSTTAIFKVRRKSDAAIMQTASITIDAIVTV